MSRLGRDEITALACDQLPLAARFGLGHELDQLADSLLMDERLVHLATASVDGKFGVLALTTDHLICIPAGRSTKPLAWPTWAAHPKRRGDTWSIAVACGNRSCELSEILPTDAADDLSGRLSRGTNAVA